MNGRARVGWNLRRIRVDRGISQAALAVDAGLDQAQVSRIEKGNENPSVDLLDRLAQALNVDVAEFLVQPKRGEKRAAPLKSGRRPRS